MITCEFTKENRRPLELSTYSDKMLNWYFRSRYKRILIEFAREPAAKSTIPAAGELPWWNRT